MPESSRSRSHAAVPHRQEGTGGRFHDGLSALGTLLVWVLILTVPLIIVPTAVDTFRLPKRMLAEWLGLASLLAFCLAAALRRGGKGTVPWRSRAFLALAPMTVVATVGLLVTTHPEHVWEGLLDLWIGVACLVGWSLALVPDRLEKLLGGLSIPATLLAGFGILQFHDLYRPFAFTRGEEAARLGITSLGGNAGDLAAFLVLPVLVAQWRLAHRAGRGRRLLWAAVLLVCLYGLAVTQTLTALAAVLAGSALFWLMRLSFRRAVGAVAAAAVAAVLLVVVVTPLRDRVSSGMERLREGQINQVLSGRLDGWRTALWMLEEHPVLGVGQGAYRAEFATAKLALIDRGVPFYKRHVDPFFANAHNEILEAGAEWGILGWLALAWGLWVLVRAVRTAFGGAPPGPPGKGRENLAFATGALTALAVLAVGQFPFRLALVAFPSLLLLAWVFRAADERAPAAESTGEQSRPDSAKLRWLAWGGAAVLALALVGQSGRWADRIGASKRLRVVEAVTAQATSGGRRVPPRVLSGSVRLLRQAEQQAPADVAVRTALAGQALLAGEPHRAEELYERALALEPRPEIYLNLGRARLAAGDRSGAVDAFRDAVRLAPRLQRKVPQTMRGEIRRRAAPKRPARSGRS